MARKTSRVRRTFTPQFKKDAVALVAAGRSVNEVAHDLGIARSLLQRWKAQLAREQLRQLQQRLRAVTEERDILKKALPPSTTAPVGIRVTTIALPMSTKQHTPSGALNRVSTFLG